MDKIFGIPVDNQNMYFFRKTDILFVQKWKKSSKVEVPMFYTKKGRYTICTTLELAKSGMPTFEYFQRWNLVNKLAIDQIEYTQFGHIVYFKDTDITTDISFAKYKNIDLNLNVDEDRLIIVTKDNFAQTVKLKEVCYIDLYESKTGIKELRFHMRDEVFLISQTLKKCSEVLKLAQVDSGIYANIDNIKHIQLSPYGATIYFVHSDYKTTMARRKVEYFKKVIPII